MLLLPDFQSLCGCLEALSPCHGPVLSVLSACLGQIDLLWPMEKGPVRLPAFWVHSSGRLNGLVGLELARFELPSTRSESCERRQVSLAVCARPRPVQYIAEPARVQVQKTGVQLTRPASRPSRSMANVDGSTAR